jgi:hypothetical protein
MNIVVLVAAIGDQQQPPHTTTLVLSFPSLPFFPASTSPGVLAKLGITSSAGFLTKKFLGRSRSVIGSAGMTGKSSGLGKWTMPKVCQRTMSVLAMFSVGLSEIHLGRPWEGSPEVWGTCRPAGWNWASLSGRTDVSGFGKELHGT